MIITRKCGGTEKIIFIPIDYSGEQYWLWLVAEVVASILILHVEELGESSIVIYWRNNNENLVLCVCFLHSAVVLCCIATNLCFCFYLLNSIDNDIVRCLSQNQRGKFALAYCKI